MATAKRKPAARKASRRPVKRQGPRKVSTVRKAPARRAKAPLRKRPAAARKLAGVGSAAVLKATGRTWEEWLKVLDRAGAKAMAHRDIAALLNRKFSLTSWWSQMVTVGYEQARGLRKVHQQASGFAANASRTMGAALDKLFHAWHDPTARAQWLKDAPVEVKRATKGRSMRIKWTPNGSNVDVGFTAKGPGKTSVQVSHGKLASPAEVARQKAFWKDALARLEAMFEPVSGLH
ncbi:MAG TPA: hypothetical protein VN598_12460 [Usitatibacter sp.]|nr:hypothetical protein [Usitatibacter sp.]